MWMKNGHRLKCTRDLARGITDCRKVQEGKQVFQRYHQNASSSVFLYKRMRSMTHHLPQAILILLFTNTPFEGYRKFKTGTSNEPVALVKKQTEPRKIPHHAVVPLNGNKYGLVQNYRVITLDFHLARSCKHLKICDKIYYDNNYCSLFLLYG